MMRPRGITLFYLLTLAPMFLWAGTAPLEYRVAILLVIIPFNIGIMLASGEDLLRLIAFFLLLALVKFVISLRGELPDSSHANLKLLGMYALWTVLGFTTTEFMKEFISMVRPSGYVYSLGLTLTGVGLSGIVVDPIFAKLEDQKWHDIADLLVINGTLVVAGISALTLLGRSQAILGARRAWAVFLRTFRRFLVLGVITNWLWQEALSEFLWWVPGIKPPPLYLATVTIVMATIAMPLQILTEKRKEM